MSAASVAAAADDGFDAGVDGSLSLPGVTLAMRSWGSPASPLKVLCVHGWMDTVGSFARLAPYLAARGAHVVALDWPGHGASAWLPPSASYCPVDYAVALAEAWSELRWSSSGGGVLVGHSMGAGAACIAAAALPGLRALVLLEGLGPYPRPPGEAAALFARALAAKAVALRAAPRAVYASIEAAAAHRAATARQHPGTQRLSLGAARRLVERALEPAGDADVAAAAGDAAAIAPAAAAAAAASAPPRGWCFRHDPRIKGPAPAYIGEEESRALLAAIACPVLLLLAVDGWPRPAELSEARARCVRDLEVCTLPGSHHLHADEDSAPAACAAVAAFLQRRGVL